MKALVLAIAVALVTPLRAQSLAPELEPLAAKYRADMAALNAQKAVAMTRAQQPYMSALDGAEKAATSAGTVGAVPAIAKEREALKSGQTMPAAFPERLPKALQATRRACLDAMARVDADLAPRQKAIDADYLRALASLQAKAATKPELAEQIAAEKEKMLANVDATKQIETLLTSKEWIHRGQYRYKFSKGGRFQQGDRGGRCEIDGKSGSVSFFWDNKDHPGEGLLFNKATKAFEHNTGGDFVPVGR
jgi:hypothetical protein